MLGEISDQNATLLLLLRHSSYNTALSSRELTTWKRAKIEVKILLAISSFFFCFFSFAVSICDPMEKSFIGPILAWLDGWPSG